MLIVFDNIIGDMEEANKKVSAKLKLLNRLGNTENSTYHNPISKCLKINVTHLIIMKIPSQREL